MEQEEESITKEPLKPYIYILDLVIMIILAVLTLIVVLTTPEGNIVRAIFGFIFVLFCPGYVFVSFLWPRNEDMNSLERIALSFGLSIAMIIVMGLILSYTQLGLGLSSILYATFSIVIILSLLSSYRRLKVPPSERFHMRIDFGVNKKDLSKLDKIVTILIIISLIVTGIIFAYVVMTSTPGERFTEFYILDQNGTTDNYPKNLTTGENGVVIIGLINHEGRRMNYSITINLLNETNYVNNTWDSFHELNDDEVYEFEFNFDIATNGTYKLEFLLYRETDTEPYLELQLKEIKVRD